MAKFLTGDELNSELGKLLENAYEQLILISPYIKLYPRYQSILKSKLKDPHLALTIVFGKNETDKSKSIQLQDFNFFKGFPNIEIKYEKNLHAKYYANDNTAILTSMNLYGYSQETNIEAGVKISASLLGGITGGILGNIMGDDNIDNHAFNYFMRVIEQSELLYKNEPVIEKSGLLGMSKKINGFINKEDKLSEYLNSKIKASESSQVKFAIEKFKSNPQLLKQDNNGYCIRTGKQIPFNPKMPLCDEAYKSWAYYKNENFTEKFCHFSGEESYGQTSFGKPILKKNWIEATAKYGKL